MDATLTVDTNPFSQIDRRFFAVLFGSMLLHAMAATWVARQPHVAEVESYEPAPIDRFAPLLPIPKTFPTVVKVAPPSPGGPVAPKPSKPPSNGGNSNRPPVMSGLVAAAVSELEGDRDIDAVLHGTQRSNVDTTALATRRERGPNEAQVIGPVVTDGAREVGLGEHVDVPAARGKVEDLIIDGPDLPDPEVFMRFINARRGALAACYERELKYHRALRGRVVVHLTVALDGRAREVAVNDESLASPAVADCIEALVRRWTFPVKPEDPQALQFPVLFSPAQ